MFLAWVKLTSLQIFCYGFGFTSVPGPYGRHWLVPERLFSVVGKMQTFCSECFCTRISCCGPIASFLCLIPVHLTLWKAISGSQCSKNLTQTKRVFFLLFFLSFGFPEECLRELPSPSAMEKEPSDGWKGRTTLIAAPSAMVRWV